MSDSDTEAAFDLIVVGAGLSGLVAAARYLQAHPNCSLKIIEQDYCLGGVWSERRIYPTFWTQWAFGIAEFADMAMTRPPTEDCINDLFKAKYTTKYLEDYVDYLSFANRSLRDRIQFNTRVQSVTKVADQWRLLCINITTAETAESKEFIAKRLMIANGLASTPRFPNLPGIDDFRGTILHARDFGDNKVMYNDNVQYVTVIGGGKSAADMVYEAAKIGKTVSWVIRRTGDESTGPAFFAPADSQTPYRNAGEMAQTRVMSSLQPCFMIENSLWTWFLHRTVIGISLVKAIFRKADELLKKRAKYKERPSTTGFEKLEHDTSLFWQNGVGGVLHHADFYDLVAAKVHIHRARVKKLLGNEVYLNDDANTHFPCDVILCGTGWERDFSMFDEKLQVQLGVPHTKELESKEVFEKWEKLLMAADDQVLSRFPILRSPPPSIHIPESRTPYRLYRGMAPLHDDTILFMNHVTLANKMFGAEAQAMWAVAFFDKNILLPELAEQEQDISLWTAWSRRRYLSNGQLGNYAPFDGVPYVDTLLNDMGLSAHRTKGMMRNFFAPFLPADLGEAWSEYMNRYHTIQ